MVGSGCLDMKSDMCLSEDIIYTSRLLLAKYGSSLWRYVVTLSLSSRSVLLDSFPSIASLLSDVSSAELSTIAIASYPLIDF